MNLAAILDELARYIKEFLITEHYGGDHDAASDAVKKLHLNVNLLK